MEDTNKKWVTKKPCFKYPTFVLLAVMSIYSSDIKFCYWYITMETVSCDNILSTPFNICLRTWWSTWSVDVPNLWSLASWVHSLQLCTIEHMNVSQGYLWPSLRALVLSWSLYEGCTALRCRLEVDGTISIAFSGQMPQLWRTCGNLSTVLMLIMWGINTKLQTFCLSSYIEPQNFML